jgi:hypothetical protein
MPRHRKGRLSSYRAQRHADNPGGRARFRHAASTSIAALFDSTGDDPDAADTVPLPSPIHYRRVHAKASTHPASSGTGVLRTAARGLLVTPWFAAASGFVIAASLWIYAPHAHLQFPRGSAIRTQTCYGACPPATSRKDSRRLTTSGKHRLETRKSGKRAGAASRHDRPAVSGLTFSYYVLPSQDGGFNLMIRVVGQRAIKDWRLAFTLRGDRIHKVSGATWQRISRDSGTASGNGQQGQWPGSGQGAGDQFGDGHHQYGFIFFVSGNGSPVRPTNCLYNGQTCVFTKGQPGPS